MVIKCVSLTELHEAFSLLDAENLLWIPEVKTIFSMSVDYLDLEEVNFDNTVLLTNPKSVHQMSLSNESFKILLGDVIPHYSVEYNELFGDQMRYRLHLIKSAWMMAAYGLKPLDAHAEGVSFFNALMIQHQ